MKKVLILKLFTIFFSLILINFYSCREDIIPPNSPVTSTNQPVTSNFLNYYSFTINAKNASYVVVDHPDFNYGSTRVFYTVNGHSEGSVILILRDKQNNVQYQQVINSNNEGNSSSLQGVIPDVVELDFYNFTGTLQIQIYRYI